MTHAVSLKPIESVDAYPLRHRVLRPHQASPVAPFTGDNNPDTFHLGAFLDEALVGVCSVVREPPPFAFAGQSARLRGMAVDPLVRGRGIGSKLLQACIENLLKAQVTLFWCHARVPAVNLYLRAGFEVKSEMFELPDIGPHFTMAKVLGA